MGGGSSNARARPPAPNRQRIVAAERGNTRRRQESHRQAPEGRRNPKPPPPVHTKLKVQQTFVVKNPVTLHKQSLTLINDETQPNIFYIEFAYDAQEPAEVTLNFTCKEVPDTTTSLLKFEGKAKEPVAVPEGINQKFRTSAENALNLLDHRLSDLQHKAESEIYPLVLVLSASNNDDGVQAQYTYATFLCPSKTEDTETGAPRNWSIKVIQQKIHYGDKIFDLQEIYGIGRATPAEAENEENDDFMAGSECVICLAEEKDTAVLPCRHMCLCRGCAEIMRVQSNKCPVCRQVVLSLLQIAVKEEMTAPDAPKTEE